LDFLYICHDLPVFLNVTERVKFPDLMKKRTLLFFALLLPGLIQAGEDLMRFRVYLKDKQITQSSAYSFSIPAFQLNSATLNIIPALSQISLKRRMAQDIDLDSTDYPVSENYLKSIRDQGFTIVTQSRWMNTAVVSAPDSLCINTLVSLPFVKSVQLVWRNPSTSKIIKSNCAAKDLRVEVDSSKYYGKADLQINMLNLMDLHSSGHKGAGKIIAVVDAGFYGVDTMSWFKDLSLVAAKDFIYPPSNIYQGHAHGTSVLSVLAANEEYYFVGSAPEADYCLLRSEDVLSEYPIEEDYWIAAAEFADSIGVDIISTSLGYFTYDMAELSYQIDQLDGKTAFITRAANIAATKGMLLIFSAGNEGNKVWKKISFPSDAENVLTIGSVQSDFSKSAFSSVGPTSDGRIKPDLMACGSNDYILNGAGILTKGSGTSFSTPLVTGLAACIWGNWPNLKANELRQYIKESGDRAEYPDTLYGYGIPNAREIMLALRVPFEKNDKANYYCYPNPAKDKLYFSESHISDEPLEVTIYNTLGQKMMKKKFDGAFSYLDVSHLPNAVYLVDIIVSGSFKHCCKILINK